MENLDVLEDNTKGQGFVEYVGGSFRSARGRGSYYARQTSMKNWLTEKYPDIAFNKRFARYIAPVVVDADTDKYKELVDDVERIALANKLLVLVDPLSSLAWISLEERFWNIVELQSEAFIKHANRVTKGKYSDWELTIKPHKGPSGEQGKQKGKKKSAFELIVADCC